MAVKAVSEAEKILQFRTICNDMSTMWEGAVPAGIPVMPEIITQMELECSGESVDIGLASDTIAPMQLSFAGAWYMMISGTPNSGKSNMLRLMLNGLLLDSSSEVVLYEPRDNNFANYESKIKRITKPEDFDAYMEQIVSTLKTRKEQYDSGETRFSIIAIMVDDYEICFEKADDKTIARLTQITKLARGLGVFLYISGKAASISMLYNQGDNLTMQMVSAAHAIALGGDLLNHPNYSSDLSTSDKTIMLGANEGYYFCDGKARRFKSALARKEQTA